MRYKILAFILVIVLIFPSIPALASALTSYDYEFTETYCGSTGEESRKINILKYFQDSNIYNIYLESITVGGNDGRGVVISYEWATDTNPAGIFQVPSNPGDDPIGEYEIIGIGSRKAFSIKAEQGEIHFKEMVGRVDFGEGYKDFIIRFPGSDSDTDPDPDPDPDPEPEPEPPDTPRNIEVDSKAGDIIVTWDPVPGADGYKVWIDGKPVDVGDTTKYIFPADPGEHEIQVSAYNDDGESSKSNPVTVVRPPDNPIIIVNPPCEPPPVLDVNIVGVKNPIPIYFPDPPAPPKAPSINPLPNPGNYIPEPSDFDMEPNMPSYNPRHYDPSKDGPIFEYNPPPLDIPEPIESPGPLPAIPEPVIMPHDDPLDKDEPKTVENPIISESPINPEEPRETDPVEVEPPREMTGYEPEPPRNMTGYTPEPPRDMTGYTPEPPREMTGYERESPYIPEPPKKMDPPR